MMMKKEYAPSLPRKLERFALMQRLLHMLPGKELLNADELPDILLLDIRMPEVSGMDVAKILRDRDWRKILIFITGEED